MDIIAPDFITRKDGYNKDLYYRFFTDIVKTESTVCSYSRAIANFLDWCDQNGVRSLSQLKNKHVELWVKTLNQHAPATINQRVSAVRRFFKWLMTNKIIHKNNIIRHRYNGDGVEHLETLTSSEVERLFDAIDTSTLIGLRDRALIGILLYGMARISFVITMRVKDVVITKNKSFIRLQVKEGIHELPCHPLLKTYLNDYLTKSRLIKELESPLFRPISKNAKMSFTASLDKTDAYRIIRKRAAEAGITRKIGSHSLRATGIMSYLRNGGKLEIASIIANHANIQTTYQYQKKINTIDLGEIERI